MDKYIISTDEYTIINSCCIEGLIKMKKENKTVQLTITSPPYYNVKDYVNYTDYKEYLNILKNVFSLIYDITDEGRMCCVNLSNILVQRKNRNSESSRIPLAFHFVPLMEEIGWKFIEDIVWIKPEGASKNRNGGFYQHRQPVAYKPNIINEYIFVFQKPSKYLIDKIVRSYDAITSLNSKVEDDYERTNIWKINPETKSPHPAPYPELLVEKLIKYYSFLSDELVILCDENNSNILKNNFEYDPTILIYKEYKCEYKKIIYFSEKNINEIYNELNIDNKIKKNYFIYL